MAASQLYFQNTYSFSMLRFIFNTVVVQTERQICEIHQNSNSSCSYHQCATHIIFYQVSFQDSLKPTLRAFPAPKFSWGRPPRLPLPHLPQHHWPYSFAPSLPSGAPQAALKAAIFTWSRRVRVRIFWVDRLRPMQSMR